MLTIRDLCIVFNPNFSNEKVVLEHFDLSIESGQIVSLVGESGSGKTMVSLAILGLLPEIPKLVQGQIFWNEIDLLSSSEADLCKIRGNEIAMIFQEPMSAMNPLMRIKDQLDEAITIHQKEIPFSERKKKITKALKDMQLSNIDRILDSFPHQISGGQLQRIMIAMALLNGPQLLIADEPTTALDVTVQKEIIHILKDLKDEYNMSILFISHDLGLVSSISDKIAVLHNGHLKDFGSVETILYNPTSEYTKNLLASMPTFKGQRRLLLQKNEPKSIPENEYKTRLEHRLRLIDNAPRILEINKIKVEYPTKRDFFGRVKEYHIAVKDLNLTLKKGEILGIVGESGSGKSSLAKALLRLIDPVMGEIKLFDADWLDLQGRELRLERKRMQLIFQDPFASLNPKMKIGEAILEPMLEHKIYPPAEAYQKTLELLQKVGLQVGDFNKYPSQFSGGQRQRISIARALALNPEVLVCDESVSALDVTVQAQVLQLLLDIQRERDLSIIFISHDMAVVYNICDRIVVMKSGEIVEEGDVEHIFFNAAHPYTQNLLDAVPKIPKHNA